MKKYLMFLLALTMVLWLAGCQSDRTHEVMEAWTGEYSDAACEAAISRYQNEYEPMLPEGKGPLSSVTFTTDHTIASCSVIRTAVAHDDPQTELDYAIYLHVPTGFVDDKVTLSTDWWYESSDWTKDHQIWSYLVRVTDTEGIQHFYYFRVDY
ncbi:MAG: hypothetical protein II320_01795 [Oscillospiraceae bacterium]|nr:hypothetical protein [Oscillospiraceae bacterium]